MPEVDGYQATATVRELDSATGRHTIIVAMTADVLPTNRQHCMDIGMDDFFGKPIQISILANVLRRVSVLPPLPMTPSTPATAPSAVAPGGQISGTVAPLQGPPVPVEFGS
jgi:DNA-binding NarL/FixJ family response regulator